ncbi:MAG TPA: pitrilysin family protein, partial [Blastocatellia bacterium]|nr:pitrilysin family protein [Blastocatellia bacterium]
MQRFRYTLAFITITLLIVSILPDDVRSQSGRGRPKVPTPEPGTPPPPPPKVPAAAALVKQEQAGSTSRFTLKNGMTVIISELHAAPIAASVAYFKTGAADDPEGAGGMTRLLAQMVMRGTPSRPADRLAAQLRSIGALGGVEVSPDGTAYHLLFRPEALKDALAIQADMLKNPALPAADLSREASQIIAATLDRAAMEIAVERAGKIAFDDSRFGRAFSTSGAAGQITREHLLEFYRTAYRPENLIVSIAGDVSTFNTLIEVQQLYGDFATPSPQQPAQSQTAGPAAKPQPEMKTATPPQPSDSKASAPGQQTAPQQPPPPRLRYASERGDTAQAIVTLAFRVPGASSKERAALDMLAAVLGEGRGSRLYRSLVAGQSVANHVAANYFAAADQGLLAVQARMDAKLIDKAESDLFKEIERLRRVLASEAEIARARALLEKRHIDETGTYLGRALLLARAEAERGGFRTALDYRKALGEVRAEDVQRAAAKYFELANTTVYEYEPLSSPARTFDAERFAATVTAWVPEFGKSVEPKEVRPPEPKSDLPEVARSRERSIEQQVLFDSIQPLAVKDFSTLNGPRAFVREDHSQPSVAVALLFQGGRVVEDDTNGGITELMLRSMLHGTPRRSSAQVSQELEQLGASIEVVSEPDFFGFVLSTLSDNADRALKIVTDLIEEPAFRDDDIERARVVQIGLIRQALDMRRLRARNLLFQALYPTHPYAIPIHGSEEAVSKITGDQLREWHTRTVKRQLPLVVVVGDTEGSALISGQIAEGFRRRDVDKTLKLRVPQPASAAQKVEPTRERQTAICVGFGGPRAENSTYAAFELIEAAMNGSGGRLSNELINKQGLASSVRLQSESLLVAGAVYALVVTAPENEQRARAAVLSEMERFARSGLSAEEIESARALAAMMKIASLQSQPVRAVEYARAV